jgi:hypothetical protein
VVDFAAQGEEASICSWVTWRENTSSMPIGASSSASGRATSSGASRL